MFTQTTEYALRAMAALALFPGTLVATSSVAERTKVPSNYLAKVLQQLAAAGLIEGRRGVGGGYKLARPATDINMLEIIRAVGRLQRITTCPLGLSNHGPNLCPLHRRMDDAANMLIERFSGVSLSDLISDAGSINRPLCDEQTAASLTVKGASLH
ncbi:MAG: RrF2 family transcriptional regulator [Phycisphaerales bacterium]